MGRRVFPSQKPCLKVSGVTEEERRLGYVGITRARKQAYITLPPIVVFMVNGSRACLPALFGKFLQSMSVFWKVLLLRHSPYHMDRKGRLLLRNLFLLFSQPLSSSSKFRLGQRVFHLKFGYGRVTEVEGDRVTVNFDHTGYKKLMEGFLKPAH